MELRNLTELPTKWSLRTESDGTDRDVGANIKRVGFVEGILGNRERVTAFAALFPSIRFEPLGDIWPDRLPANMSIAIVPVDSASPQEVETAVRRLKQNSGATAVIITLRNADVLTMRRLVREGAADVLPTPVGEPALALSLERLLSRVPVETGPPRKNGKVVAFLKAGGGVGATSLGVQVAAMLARAKPEPRVCFADLDVQNGAGAVYLDIADAVTLMDCLATTSALEETPFATALGKHKSGARVLAAPRELVPLEVLSPATVDMLIAGLKRDFAVTLVDLPPVWTAWTNRVLELSDRIVVVTELSVSHVHLVRRQLAALSTQHLDRQVTLVCNAVSAEQQSSLSLKAAERAVGRAFDIVVPEDRKIMSEAINQGLEISAIRRGSKLEKPITQLADMIAADALVQQPPAMRR